MKIKLNQISFDVVPVPDALRTVLLTDPVIRRAVLRDVWSWDHATATGKSLVETTDKGGIPLPNGLSFFVGKKGPGPLVQSDGPSRAMARRVVETVGARSIQEVLSGLQQILGVPTTAVPQDAFAPLRPSASLTVALQTEFDVVQLREAGRNLSIHVFVPGQVSFHGRTSDIADQAAYDAAVAADPRLPSHGPAFVVPPRTQANRNLRLIALAARVTELQEMAKALTEGGKPLPSGPLRNAIARSVAEWRAIAPKPAANTPARPAAANS